MFIDGGFKDKNGRTDDEIIVDFARAFAVDGNAQGMLVRVDRRYVTGFSVIGDVSRPGDSVEQILIRKAAAVDKNGRRLGLGIDTS